MSVDKHCFEAESAYDDYNNELIRWGMSSTLSLKREATMVTPFRNIEKLTYFIEESW